MATVSNITVTPHSGLNHIDALLDVGPDWNYLTSATPNTIYYTFSITSGIEIDSKTKQPVTGQETFTLEQQVATRTAFSYLAEITGIQFVETAVGSNAQIHLANLDIKDSQTVGLASWQSSYSYVGDQLKSYSANAWVYLDNVEWRFQNRDLTPGGPGYQTLLHELGHALGLRHPFHEADEHDHIHLPAAQDNTANTLMSYKDVGGPYSTFGPYDIAALNWLYGRDGLGGRLGVGAEGSYFTGTDGDDIFYSTKGNDMFDGRGGNDTVVYTGPRSNYTITNNVDGSLRVASVADGIDTLLSIEELRFTDMSVSRANVADTVAPAAPTFTVTKNAAGYATGSDAIINGAAEANSTVTIYVNQTAVGTATVGANGLWKFVAKGLPDGLNYRVHATATDAAGNTSASSAIATFNIDGKAPTTPTNTFTLDAGGNRPVFSGTGEAGTTISLIHVTEKFEIARTTVGADGKWSIASAPLPNGTYSVNAVSIDIGDNVSAANSNMNFVIASSANQNGTPGNDRFTAGAGDNAINGGAGIDTVVYAGSMADYTIARGVWGSTVTAKSGNGGTDGLYNVERVQFSDGYKALDIEGVGGQVYRLYEAVLGRPAEAAGQGYWMWRMESTGTSLLQVANEFMKQKEFDALYGINPTEAQFVRQLYLNILDREPDAAGYEYWINVINDDNRAQIIVDFSEGFENKAQVIEIIGSGIEFTPWNQP
ncbi:DUF4214 domain-containing protein [Massilia consociata]|uniref:DUF4214 domain-containing protein n=1 Tax=Massilia consociata TaxID=760117 RepID=A0ABV6FGF7_9BURK